MADTHTRGGGGGMTAVETPGERHNRRLGLGLFAIYLVVYVGFVALVVVDYKATGKVLFGGLNLAIVYGMALIIGAMVLSLLYTWLARPDEPAAEAIAGEEI